MIRENPDDIYAFSAEYFRQKAGVGGEPLYQMTKDAMGWRWWRWAPSPCPCCGPFIALRGGGVPAYGRALARRRAAALGGLTSGLLVPWPAPWPLCAPGPVVAGLQALAGGFGCASLAAAALGPRL